MQNNPWYPSAWHIVWKLNFDRWTLFIHWSVITVNSACVMIKTRTENMGCNNSVRAVADFIYRHSEIIQSILTDGEGNPDEHVCHSCRSTRLWKNTRVMKSSRETFSRHVFINIQTSSVTRLLALPYLRFPCSVIFIP